VPPSSLEVEPYDVPRGTCSRCAGRGVRHHIIGMPAPPEAMGTIPKWVEWEGFIHPGYTRSCGASGLTWTEDDDDDL
jgi:hypothetical protein